MKKKLTIDIMPQPDDTTCGPTCLHAVYRYYDDPITIKQVVSEVTHLESGGTLAGRGKGIRRYCIMAKKY